jgi:hypothetical protein
LLSHLFNLLVRSWASLISAMGTTTFALVVGCCGFLFILALNLLSKLHKDGWSWRVTVFNFGHNLKESVVPTTIVTVGLWMGLYAVFVIKTIYADHQSLVARVREQTQRLSEREEEHCVMQNVSLFPPRNHPEAKSASETLMFCKTERKAPFYIWIDYDKNLLSVTPLMFSEGRMIDARISLKGGQLFAKVSSPSILPYQMFIATVFGQDETPPIATKLTIHPIDPER